MNNLIRSIVIYISIIHLSTIAYSINHPFIYFDIGYYYLTNSPTLQRNTTLKVTNPISINFDNIKITDKIDSKAQQYAFMLGYQIKKYRYGLEISRRTHNINTSISNNDLQIPIDPANLSSLLGLGGLNVSNTIGPTITKIKNKMQATMILGKIFYDYPITNSIYGHIGFGIGTTHINLDSSIKIEVNIIKSLFGDQVPDLLLNSIISNYPELNLAEKQSQIKLNQTVLTGQLITGVFYKIDKNIIMFIEYHLTQTTKVKSPINKSLTNNSVILGLIFKFT